MADKLSRRALLTGGFRSEAEPSSTPSPPSRRTRRRDSGAPPSAEQRAALDAVLDQMNGPTGFEDLEARKS